VKLTVRQILEATGGTLVRGDAGSVVQSVSTDTRTLQPGDLFVALGGENFDGEKFVPEALQKGAGGVICRDAGSVAGAENGAVAIRHDDPLRAFGQIASAWRRTVSPMVVGITGSSGKTTVKELAAHLCKDLSLVSTKGNFNNLVGLPKTLLELTEKHTDAIVELGMNHAGELTRLTEITQPDIGVLTNVGDAHLGNFENLDGLIAAKAELFATMRRNTTAIINVDDANSRKMFEMGVLPWEVITYGESDTAKIRATNINHSSDSGWKFTINFYKWDVDVQLPLFGRWQIHNALAAATIALLLGVTPETIAARMATFNPPNMRSQIKEAAGVSIVVDCYNASPSATIAALRSFETTPEARHRYALLGDMSELGAFEKGQHRRVGAAAAELGLAGIFTTGEASRYIAEEARDCGATATHFPNRSDAVEALVECLEPGDALLVKASRRAKLEQVLELLEAKLREKEQAN